MKHSYEDLFNRCTKCGASAESVMDGNVPEECRGGAAPVLLPVCPTCKSAGGHVLGSPCANQNVVRDTGCGYGCGADRQGNMVSRTDCPVHGAREVTLSTILRDALARTKAAMQAHSYDEWWQIADASQGMLEAAAQTIARLEAENESLSRQLRSREINAEPVVTGRRWRWGPLL